MRTCLMMLRAGLFVLAASYASAAIAQGSVLIRVACVAALPETLKSFGLTDDVKRRGGDPISGTTKIFAHLAVPFP